jgi:hypothetical protein
MEVAGEAEQSAAQGPQGQEAERQSPACPPAAAAGRPSAQRKKERGGGLDEGIDDDGDMEELDDGGTEGAGISDGEAGDCDEDPGGDVFAADEGLDEDRTLDLRWAQKD